MSTQVDPAITQATSTTSGAPTDWRATLPEELRGEKSFEKFKSVPEVAKSYLELQKSMGNAIRIPKADAKPEEWDTYYSKIGRPESPDKYELKHPEADKGGKYDEALEKEVRAHAHANGLTTVQAQKELDWINGRSTQQLSAFRTSLEEGVANLKKEWGADFDKKIGPAAASIKEFGGDDFVKVLDESGLGNHPMLIKYAVGTSAEIAGLRAKIAQLTGEDRMIIGDAGSGTDNRQAIQLKIDAIQRDPKHPFNDSKATTAAREAAIAEMSGLWKQLYPPAQE